MNIKLLRPFLSLTRLNIPYIRPVSTWKIKTWMEMKKRAEKAEPQPERPRSGWINWNYDAEIFAFGKRLNEEFRSETLKSAFIHQSYIEEEEKRRKELGVPSQNLRLEIEDQAVLAKTGDNLLSKYVERFLKNAYQHLPYEGILALKDFIMSVEVLSHVGKNIGISDLILCSDVKPSDVAVAETFKAVVGAVEHDQDTNRAELFVQDFLLVQLIGKEISEIWDIPKPIGVLAEILRKENLPPFESRLLWQSGHNTILSVYNVGIYCNKKLIGASAGETVGIAEEMAVCEALKNLFKIKDNIHPLPFGDKGRNLQLVDSGFNLPLSEWKMAKEDKEYFAKN